MSKNNEIVLDLSKLKIQEKHYLPLSIILASIILGASIIIGSNNVNNVSRILSQDTKIQQQDSAASTNNVKPTNDNTITDNNISMAQQKVDKVVSTLGLDKNTVNTCIQNNQEISNLIITHRLDGSEIGVQGTPGFVVGKINGDFVEGILIPGAFPYDTFKSVIDAYLEGNNDKVKEIENSIKSQLQIKTNDSIIVKTKISNAGAKGSSSASIGIVEYLDMNCSFCKKHFQQTFPLLDQNYISTNKVRYFKKHFTIFGAESDLLAKAAECIRKDKGDSKFYEAMSLFLTN
ncbi:MAG: thioredoxin domain-containing protein [Candidatus Dojkabacteria bacterium]|nr:thioredoxin domain-containing protein [Candidatus Dojkabacteria bacterium]